MQEIGIYIHIPFCLSKCNYCDFLSFPNHESYFEKYTEALIREIDSFEKLKTYEIKTIFIGGGTPSLLPLGLISKILSSIYKYNLSKSAEISIELNPETVTKEKLREYKKMNINRLSFGLQSTENEILKFLGRAHSYEKFLEAYNMAKDIGFDNINIDLIFAIPGQTLEIWESTLKKVINLGPKHISAYSLIVEEGTPFSNLLEKGALDLTPEDTDRNMYSLLKEMLKDNNIYQYEISNFSVADFECVHNKIYWQRKEYKGFGLAAHSFYSEKRFSNTCDLQSYLGGRTIEEETVINKTEAMEEFIFLGLRMTEGIRISEFYNNFGVDIWDKYGSKLSFLIREGLLNKERDFLSLTNRGIDVSNCVFAEILT